jgi:hypothetical protein
VRQGVDPQRLAVERAAADGEGDEASEETQP